MTHHQDERVGGAHEGAPVRRTHGAVAEIHRVVKSKIQGKKQNKKKHVQRSHTVDLGGRQGHGRDEAMSDLSKMQ